MQGHTCEDVVVKINHSCLLAGAGSPKNTPESFSERLSFLAEVAVELHVFFVGLEKGTELFVVF